MNNTTYQKVIKSVLTTVVGISFSQSLFVSSVKANDYQVNNQTTSAQVNTVAVNSISDLDFIETRLYEHQWQNRQVITLQFKNIPLLTFLSAPNYDAKEVAIELARTLEQLSQESIDGSEITVAWNNRTKDYSLKYKEQELIRINKYVFLPDSTDNLSQDALQITNRLRRLMGNAEPLTKITGKGKTKYSFKQDSRMTAFTDLRNGGKVYNGRASWYGPGFHGRRTASGEIFNQNALTAAHRYLPFGTKVLVTNLRNGRSVVVKINDRGPYTHGRIVDLSAEAARIIGLKNTGVGQVTMQVLTN